MIKRCNYNFTDTVLLRSPVYSHQDYNGARGLRELLNDRYFRSSISLASNSLFRELKVAEFNYEKLSIKARLALLKYYNRMCYRPTPFGQFSGIGVATWGIGSIALRDKMTTHCLPDFATSVKQANVLLNAYLPDQLTYRVNESLYELQNEYRYLRYRYDNETKRSFFLHGMERSKSLTAVLKYLDRPRSGTEIKQFLSKQFQLQEASCNTLFSQLTDEQIILPVMLPAITGEDYLQRVKIFCSRLKQDADPGDNRSAPDEIDHTQYVNLVYDISGQVNMKYQQLISDGLFAIDRLVANREHSGLQKFIRLFQARFDRQVVPLMEALDPEIGVGYESLAAELSTSALLRDVSFDNNKENNRQLNWSAAHAYLLEQWNKMVIDGKNKVISLEKEGLDKLPLNASLYPQSCSVLFRSIGDAIYLEQAGGVTGTALLGRFSLFNDHIRTAAKQLASLEEAANPGVVFAEISHICDDHTANIDRRPHLYNYEIPILSGSSMDQDRHLPLSDLWIMVREGQIILWSKKLRKRIIPRLSSAFNYLRNDLSVFRFLCDLQQQGLKTNFNFELSEFFPALDFYPRVQYGAAILQLAEWHLKTDRLTELATCTSESEQISQLKKWQMQLAWPQYITLSEHDNELVFNTTEDSSLLFLAASLKGLKKAIIKEFPFCDDCLSVLMDSKRKPYTHQIVATLFHNNAIYKAPKPKPSGSFQLRRKYMPGSEWLYCKIYAHPRSANEILLQYVSPLLGSKQAKKFVKKWFFIRYKDPSYHLRIRINIDTEFTGKIMTLLNRRFSRLADSGIISNFQISTYEREIERYSPLLMGDIEQLFCNCSGLILSFIKNAPANESSLRYFHVAFSTIIRIAAIFCFSLEIKIVVFRDLYQSMLTEFEVSKTLNEQLKQKYREINHEKIFIDAYDKCFVDSHTKMQLSAMERSCFRVVNKINDWPATERIQLFSDIIHMHLNRLVVNDNGKQELLVYFCLFKHFQSVKGRSISSFSSSVISP